MYNIVFWFHVLQVAGSMLDWLSSVHWQCSGVSTNFQYQYQYDMMQYSGVSIGNGPPSKYFANFKLLEGICTINMIGA